MILPPPSPTSGPGFDPLATCRELAQLIRIYQGEENRNEASDRIGQILYDLSQNSQLAFPLFYPPEAQHNILREGPSPENPTEALSDQQSFFDQIPEN